MNPSFTIRIWSLTRTKYLEFAEQKENHREQLQIFTGTPLSLPLMTHQCTDVRKLLQVKEKPSERSNRKNLRSSHRARMVHVPTQEAYPPWGQSTQKAISSVMLKN